jgi:hypothetical protein
MASRAHHAETVRCLPDNQRVHRLVRCLAHSPSTASPWTSSSRGNASTAGLGRSLVLKWIDECRPCHPQLNDQTNRMGICTSARENRGNPKKISS